MTKNSSTDIKITTLLRQSEAQYNLHLKINILNWQ